MNWFEQNKSLWYSCIKIFKKNIFLVIFHKYSWFNSNKIIKNVHIYTTWKNFRGKSKNIIFLLDWKKSPIKSPQKNRSRNLSGLNNLNALIRGLNLLRSVIGSLKILQNRFQGVCKKINIKYWKN